MISDIIRHRLDYCLLALISGAYIIYFLSNQTDTIKLLIATFTFGLSYILWGVFHHLRTRTLHPKVMVEYCLVSIFAIIIVSTLLI